MTRWLLVAPLLVLAACNQDDDDRVTVVDTDTDVPCRGCETDDSDIGLATDEPVDTDANETGDTDSDLRDDTFRGCLIGDIPDCTGACFPEWMLGDGHCDDGKPLPADFDCPQYSFDQGDCVSDTDTDEETGIEGGGCGHYRLEFHTRDYPGEISWTISEVKAGDFGGYIRQNIYSIAPNTYTVANSVYVHDNLYLTPGHYQLEGRDHYIFPDGWGGAFWYLIDEATGLAVAKGGAPETPLTGASRVWKFQTSCARTSCDMRIDTIGGANGGQMAWELYNNASKLVAERSAGTIPSNGTVSDTVHLYEGTYTIRTRDLGNDGWGSGRVETRYAGGLLLRTDGMFTGGNGLGEFTVTCAHEQQPAFDAPPTLAFSSCQGVKLAVTERGTAPEDVGWQLYRADTWRQVIARAPGSYTFGALTDAVTLESGLYYIQQVDLAKDGWEGARLRLEDPNGTTLLTALLPQGASTGRYFRAECPPPVPDTDTDPVETDHSDEPGPTCLRFALPDCAGVCMPEAFLGDGFCDDGVQSAANFACVEQAFDDGDCAPQQPAP